MKTQIKALFIGLALMAGIYGASAQLPVITSFSQNGVLVCSNLVAGSVETVEWYDCVKWSNARSQQADLTPVYYTDAGFKQVYTNGDIQTVVYQNLLASGYRLPTEAEWETAARGGWSGARFPWSMTISESQANYYADPSVYTYDLGPYTGYNTNYDTGGVPYTSPVGTFHGGPPWFYAAIICRPQSS